MKILRYEITKLEPKKKISILQLKTLKSQGRLTEHNAIVNSIKSEFGSLKAAAESLQVPQKSFTKLCNSKKKEKEEKVIPCNVHAKEFWEVDGISITDPSICYAGKYFLLNSVEETYKLYRSNCKKMGLDPVSLSTFNRLQPKNIFTLKHIPDKYCICDVCENHKMFKSALEKAQVKGIPEKMNRGNAEHNVF